MTKKYGSRKAAAAFFKEKGAHTNRENNYLTRLKNEDPEKMKEFAAKGGKASKRK